MLLFVTFMYSLCLVEFCFIWLCNWQIVVLCYHCWWIKMNVFFPFILTETTTIRYYCDNVFRCRLVPAICLDFMLCHFFCISVHILRTCLSVIMFTLIRALSLFAVCFIFCEIIFTSHCIWFVFSRCELRIGFCDCFSSIFLEPISVANLS